MLIPKKQKYRKHQKGRRRNKSIATRGTTLSFGDYGLKTLEYGWITARQIEAVRRTITRNFKKKGKIWIRIFPDKPITAKGSEIPMGGGKGAVDRHVAVVKPGKIMFEVTGVSEEVAKSTLRAAAHKLPVKCRFITRL